MTDEQRKQVALEYLKGFDNGGVTSPGRSILDLFAPDAQVYFPKWGLAKGREQIGKLFSDVGGTIKSIALRSLSAVSETLRRHSAAGDEGMSVAGVFWIQRLEGSRFGRPTLWALNGGAAGAGWRAEESVAGSRLIRPW
jgi:hypothetical protein